MDLDGILFYNKMVHYLPGSTPLVGWLKGFMVPDLLKVPVSNEILAQRPNNFSTMKNYIKEYGPSVLALHSNSQDLFSFEPMPTFVPPLLFLAALSPKFPTEFFKLHEKN